MAIVGLFVVGSLIGGAIGGTVVGISAATIGGAIGGAIGGFLDSQLIFPAIFGNSSGITGPRIDDFSMQTASEGSAIKRCFGKYNKVAGTVIWLSDIREVHRRREQGGKGGPTVVTNTYTYYASMAVGVCHGEISSINQILADSKMVYKSTAGFQYMTSLTMYTGSDSQLPNALMESYLGAGNVPGYVGLAYVVIEDLHLKQFGNRIPNLLFDVDASGSHARAHTVIRDLLLLSGISNDYFDVLDLPLLTVNGLVVEGPQTTREAIEVVMLEHNLFAQLIDGVLVFKQRGQEDTVEFVEEQLGTKEYGGDSVPLATITDTPSYELPTEMTVKFIDLGTHNQSGVQSARRLDRVLDTTAGIDIPIAMNATEARQIAERRLWTAWSERSAIEVSLPMSAIHVNEGDLISVPFMGETYVGRVIQIDRGANFLHKIKAVITQTETATNDATAEEGTYVSPDLYEPPDLKSAFIDGPALSEDHINSPVYYWGACAEDFDFDIYLSASVLESLDDVDFEEAQNNAVEATLGETLTALDNTNALQEMWDNENTVDLELFDDTISTVSEDECLAGKNRAFIGNELIGFKTVTSIGTNQYRLSCLLRGLRDTDVEEHAIGERVFVLSPTTGVGFVSYSTSQIGTTKHFKFVAQEADPTAISSESHVLSARTCLGFAPNMLQGSLDSGTGDWTLSWLRRTRAFTRFLQSTPIPLEEPFERYEVDVMDGPDVIRTISVEDATSVVYTSAQQTTDFGSPQTTLTFRVYQITNILGRGKMAEVTV